MKKAIMLGSFPAAFLVGFIVMLAVGGEPPPAAPSCRVAVSEDLQHGVGNVFGAGAWTVYSFDGNAKAPVVTVRELNAKELAVPDAAGGCEFEFDAMPGADSRGLDWRIGRAALNPTLFRGRTVRARFLLKAAQEANFGSASVYLYDGAAVDAVPVKTLGPEWTPFEVVHAVPKDAKAFELWFRLMLDRPDVTPQQNKIRLAVFLDQVPEGAVPGANTSGLLPGPGRGETAHMQVNRIAPSHPSLE
jgi:hypothetical protein